MIDLKAALSQSDIERIFGALNLAEPAIRTASRRAVLKTARWVQAQTQTTISSELQIEKKLARTRLKLYRKGAGLEQKVWLGLNAIGAKRLGKQERVEGGTQVGQHFFKGAFPIPRFNNGVFRRTGRERFPLETAKLDIEEIGAAALRDIAQRTDERLMHYLQQELRYELTKIGM